MREGGYICCIITQSQCGHCDASDEDPQAGIACLRDVCSVQAAIFCQFLEPVDYELAFGILSDSARFVLSNGLHNTDHLTVMWSSCDRQVCFCDYHVTDAHNPAVLQWSLCSATSGTWGWLSTSSVSLRSWPSQFHVWSTVVSCPDWGTGYETRSVAMAIRKVITAFESEGTAIVWGVWISVNW